MGVVIYDNLADTEADLLKMTTTGVPTMVGIVTGELLKDSNVQGVAPKQDGTLVNSSKINSLLEEGLIIYATPYARRLYYEGSITGRLQWVERTALLNNAKYKKMFVKLIAKKKNEIF